MKDLHLFNVALLGRQLWRLINDRETLCFKVLSPKYFPNGEVLNPKNVDKPSYDWTSLRSVAMKLEEGFVQQVGDGKTVRIHTHRWGLKA